MLVLLVLSHTSLIICSFVFQSFFLSFILNTFYCCFFNSLNFSSCVECLICCLILSALFLNSDYIFHPCKFHLSLFKYIYICIYIYIFFFFSSHPFSLNNPLPLSMYNLTPTKTQSCSRPHGGPQSTELKIVQLNLLIMKG